MVFGSCQWRVILSPMLPGASAYGGVALYIAILACALSGCGPTGRWRPSDFYKDKEVIALIKAAEKGDVVEIDRLVAKGVNVNERGKDGMTPLLFSMWAKNKAGFRRLLELGADPNLQLDDGESVTSSAASHAYDSDWLRMILQHGGDPNPINPKGHLADEENRTPLFAVSYGQRMNSLRMLINSGADLNHRDRCGSTPIMFAIENGWYVGALEMLNSDADPMPKNKYGEDLAVTCFQHLVDPSFATAFQAREKILAALAAKGIDLRAAEERANR